MYTIHILADIGILTFGSYIVTMKRLSIVIVLCFPFMVDAQAPTAPLISGKYSWKQPRPVKKGMAVATVFEGVAHDFEYMAMDACVLAPARRKQAFQVPSNEEHLLMIRSGVMEIAFGDSTWSIGPGSIALIMPGDRYTAKVTGSACNFFRLRYRSKVPMDLSRGVSAGGSFVRDWNKLVFRPHDRGGVRRYFQRATAMSRRFEMHVTTLDPGLKSHEPHTHLGEEIILMFDDPKDGAYRTEMLIGDQTYQGGEGDFYYMTSNTLHGIKNIGQIPCSYFAFQFQ